MKHTYERIDGKLIKYDHRPDGSVKVKSYLNDNHEHHHDDGAAIIHYRTDKSISKEYFRVNGKDPSDGRPSEIHYNTDQSPQYKAWTKDFMYHRDDGPAIIRYNSKTAWTETWIKENKTHRDNNEPAVIVYRLNQIAEIHYYTDNIFIKKVLVPFVSSPKTVSNLSFDKITNHFYEKNLIESEKKDGYIINYTYHPSGLLKTETWTKDGLIDREDNSAIIEFYSNGQIKKEIFKVKGKEPEGVPSEIHYDFNGSRTKMKWKKNGVSHREDGPAIIHYSAQGNQTLIWYKEGLIHRDDGPAIIRNLAKSTIEKYWKNGEEIKAPKKSKNNKKHIFHFAVNQ